MLQRSPTSIRAADFRSPYLSTIAESVIVYIGALVFEISSYIENIQVLNSSLSNFVRHIYIRPYLNQHPTHLYGLYCSITPPAIITCVLYRNINCGSDWLNAFPYIKQSKVIWINNVNRCQARL
jgi:hypothetical protein